MKFKNTPRHQCTPD